MYIEQCGKLTGQKLNIWKDFMEKSGLIPDLSVSRTVLIWDDDLLIASGSRQDNLIKCIAVDPQRQGEGLTATLITSLRQEAFSQGLNHLFLYTKPENSDMFSSLFFYPIAQTDKVLLMETKKNGISQFLSSLPKADTAGTIGSIVMNCNPFTLGHQYLIETAAKECDHLYVFAVSEDKSEFSYEDRLEMMKRGTCHIPNISILPTGPYLISSSTFPDYFLKEREKVDEIHCILDVEVFSKHFAPHFSITRRYVGTEPISKATDCYNTALKENLPKAGIEVKEIPRLTADGSPISASEVRNMISKNRIDSLKNLVPKTTFEYLKSKNLI